MNSFKRHNIALKKEHSKVNANRAVVSKLMSLSFEMRRNDILSCSKPVAELLQEYPFLGDYEEVSMKHFISFMSILNCLYYSC